MVEKRVKRIEEILLKKQPDLQILLDNVHSSQNLSAIIRSCDAVGVLHLYYAAQEERDLRIHKTITQGAHRWVERKRVDEGEKVSFLKQKREEGFQVVVTHLTQQAVSFREVDYTLPTMLVVGNEKEGVSEEILEVADSVVLIPMQGMVQSLNVSVATALILYEAQRQLELVGKYSTPELSESQREEMRDRWIHRDYIARRSKGRIEEQQSLSIDSF